MKFTSSIDLPRSTEERKLAELINDSRNMDIETRVRNLKELFDDFKEGNRIFTR